MWVRFPCDAFRTRNTKLFLTYLLRISIVWFIHVSILYGSSLVWSCDEITVSPNPDVFRAGWNWYHETWRAEESK